MSENRILRGHNDICRYLGLPWPTVWRLATAGGLAVNDLDGALPTLAAGDWLAWQQWESGGQDKNSATA